MHVKTEVISTGMEEVMNRINALIAQPQIEIDDVLYTLETVLGGDYKVTISLDKRYTQLVPHCCSFFS